MSTVDLIPAPSADAVAFRQRPSRVFVTMAAVTAAMLLLSAEYPWR